MKVGYFVLSLALGAGSTLPAYSSASDLDKYKATISFVNHGGKTLILSGCNATDKDNNKCHVHGAPVQVAPNDTTVIGDAENSGHSADGYFVFSDKDLPDQYHLNYKFDKKVEESSLGITHVSGDSAVSWVIDPSTCSSSGGVGGVSCCTYKHSKHNLYSVYEYNCIIPVRAQ